VNGLKKKKITKTTTQHRTRVSY